MIVHEQFVLHDLFLFPLFSLVIVISYYGQFMHVIYISVYEYSFTTL